MVAHALAKRIRRSAGRSQTGRRLHTGHYCLIQEGLCLEINENNWAAIMDDNPGEFSVEINGSYREGKPFSTVPSSILAALPTLPDEIEYRFWVATLFCLTRKRVRS